MRGWYAAIEQKFSTAPPFFSISLQNTWQGRIVPTRLSLFTNSKPSGVRPKNVSSSGVPFVICSAGVVPFGWLPPAPLISTSMRFHFLRITLQAASSEALSSTFASMASVWVRPFFASLAQNCFATSPRRSSTATFAPCFSRSSVMLEHSTPAAPVQTMTFPSTPLSFTIFILSFLLVVVEIPETDRAIISHSPAPCR